MAQLSADCFAFGGALMTMAEALRLVDERTVAVTGTETVGLRDARDRILAQDVTSDRDVPPHDNAAVDGFAFRFADADPEGPTTFRLVGRAAAGHPHTGALGPAEAVRIFTGAPMPEGCDTVAMQEDCDEAGGTVAVAHGLHRGDNRRRQGEDVARGRAILSCGRRLRPQDVGLAASIGRTALEVYRPLRVAVFSSGDEITDAGRPLAEGCVYDANRYVLLGLLETLGCRVTDIGIVPDSMDAVRAALGEAAAGHDLLVTSGGVSAGAEDHVKAAIESLGRVHFWRLAIKPGRPLALGQVGTVPVLGLPGNPVAAMVTFIRFARPLVLRLSGATEVEPRLFRVRAAFDHTKKPERREWVRARLGEAVDGTIEAYKFERQGAGILSSMVDADGLVELPEEATRVVAGSIVDFLPFSEVTR